MFPGRAPEPTAQQLAISRKNYEIQRGFVQMQLQALDALSQLAPEIAGALCGERVEESPAPGAEITTGDKVAAALAVLWKAQADELRYKLRSIDFNLEMHDRKMSGVIIAPGIL